MYKKIVTLIFTLIICVGIYTTLHSTQDDTARRANNTPAFLRVDPTWADSIMASLTAEHRIAQLFMVAAYTEGESDNQTQVNNLIRNYNIGGLIYFKGNPSHTAQCINTNQSNARTPLMIGIDGEWGLSMRLDSTTIFPRQMTLGAIQDNAYIYNMGSEIARQCRLMGIHVNFAPVVDVNNNPKNPVINDRSFGDDKYNVARLGLAYMRGMQDGGILACAKHFPGHGDTDTDSHTGLPLVTHSRERLDTLELMPFRTLQYGGVASVMVAHMSIPSIEPSPNLASTLSPKIVNGLLKGELGFQGLIFTDALNMKGVSTYFAPGEVELKALLAGNDVLLFAEDVPKAISLIKKAIANGEISQEEIDRRVRKILMAKYWVGLNKYKPTVIKDLSIYINTADSKRIRKECYEQSITLAKTDHITLPIRNLESQSIATVVIGKLTKNDFQTACGRYAPTIHYNLNKDITSANQKSLLSKLNKHSVILVSLHDMKRKSSDNWGINTNIVKLINAIQAQNPNTVLVVNGNPYSLKYFSEINNILCTYEDNSTTQTIAAEVIFGARQPLGRLPLTASDDFRYGQGFFLTSTQLRLRYDLANQAGFVADSLDSHIDRIALQAIAMGATPGCQVLVARHGKVVFHKSYGFHTYENTLPVTEESIYDIASLSKICGTMLEVMKGYEEGKINLYNRLHNYIPDLDTTNKSNLLIKDVLTHTAGLKAWIPFYKQGLNENNELNGHMFSFYQNDTYNIKVADYLYLNKSYLDTMWHQIKSSPLNPNINYVYSDLGLMFMKRIVENIYQDKLETLVNKDFYECLGTQFMTYRPLEKYEKTQIVATESDYIWRKQTVHGYVHDPAAAMMGGVDGHAGLFANAHDIAIVMQMLLNGGTYGGRTYFKPETISLFTSKQCDDCRRGLGFDKPELDQSKTSNMTDLASPFTYGHTGFTGTCAWVDPQYDLIYIFLSNRIHPSADNKKLNSMDIRGLIHEAIYKSIEK